MPARRLHGAVPQRHQLAKSVLAFVDDQHVDRAGFPPMRLVIEHHGARRGTAEHDEPRRIVGLHDRRDIEEERERPQEGRAADHVRIEGDDLAGESLRIAAGHVPDLDLEAGQPRGAQRRLHHVEPEIGNELRHRPVAIRIARQQRDAAARPAADFARPKGGGTGAAREA
jgi:hypothetical protein